MAELITETFASDSGLWAGATRTISGGTLLQTEDGLTRHTTQINNSIIWERFAFTIAPDGNFGVGLSDASGNGMYIIFTVSSGQLNMDHVVAYDTHTTFDTSTDINVQCGTFALANLIGLAWDRDNNIVRCWNGVTAATEPDNATDWGGTANSDGSYDYSGFGSIQDGTYCALGNWDTGTPAAEWNEFYAGNIGSASVAPLAMHHITKNLG